MPLDVTIAGSPAIDGQTSFNLQTANAVIVYDRSPIVAPLPGGTIVLLDLGQQRINIILEGIASQPGTDLADGATRIADQDHLEEIARTWDPNNIDLTIQDATYVRTYRVKVVNLRMTLKAAVEDKWDFVMNLTGGQTGDIQA